MSRRKRKTPMTQEETSRIQIAEAKKNNGKVAKGSFAARAQSAADKNAQKRRKEEEEWYEWD